jgi:hypothetical protein
MATQKILNTDIVDTLSTPTRTHESGNHSNSHGHPKTAITWSFSVQADAWPTLTSLSTLMLTGLVARHMPLYVRLYSVPGG